MDYVKHDKWFYMESDGKEYRARYEQRGWTYATLRMQVKETHLKKRFFQKPITVEKWCTVIYNSREANITGVRDFKTFYPVSQAKEDILLCIAEASKTHTERI